ncbi:hypothetical protein Pr1d_33550 [Bythopirellula goksoeyrii]|uniref:Uncharacterized protein n=1 Tax=Bythopirellula goksoeyrii TaxID=1400387 RepID=A0A5B9QGI7_9BACT|nr:hypothetical protein Pr1d_33550 [Bythopirellula goksoeyrii]
MPISQFERVVILPVKESSLLVDLRQELWLQGGVQYAYINPTRFNLSEA